MQVRLHNMVTHTKVLGPGTRCAIWFQGCNRNCKGCMSQLSRVMDGGYLADADKLVDKVLGIEGIEGITLSGGEVFLQLDALHYILKRIKAESKLGVIIYTGYYLDELRGMNNPKVNDILNGLADIIIDGPYIDELNDGKSLKGSSNQRVNYITDRYLSCAALYEAETRDAEVYMEGEKAFFVGIPYRSTLETWDKLIKQIGGE